MIESVYHKLVGDAPEAGGPDITVWAPRQTGKSRAMLEVMKKIRRDDEFDAEGNADRSSEPDKKRGEKKSRLHALALVGVRTVFGIDNETAALFNVHRSLRIQNLNVDEARGLFLWYEKGYVNEEFGVRVVPVFVETGT